jgi:hypothetical protein
MSDQLIFSVSIKNYHVFIALIKLLLEIIIKDMILFRLEAYIFEIFILRKLYFNTKMNLKTFLNTFAAYILSLFFSFFYCKNNDQNAYPIY